MNGLSGTLSHCKAGCHINEQCMNHIIYADEHCYTKALIFNPIKFVCIAFKACRFKLYCPTITIGTEPLTYVNQWRIQGGGGLPPPPLRNA